MLKKSLLLFIVLIAIKATSAADPTVSVEIYPILDKVYSWQTTHMATYANQGITGWKHGAFYAGVMELYERTGDTKYRDFLLDISDGADWKLLRVNGVDHADNHLMAETYINLYIDEGEVDSSKINDVVSIFDGMIAASPEGRELYNWCDALFMSPPVWAQLAWLTGDNKYLTELDRLFWDSTAYLYNPNWQLYYRDSNYFGATEANRKPVFWGRGNGWVTGGLARILKYMPSDWAGRSAYVDLFVDMAARLKEIQMDSGGWSSSLLAPERFDYDTEVSGTSFFVYSLAWGINNGILDKATYGPVVEKGWVEMNRNLNADGSISNIQTVGKEPKPNDNLVGEREYGYGAFIFAGLEMAEYYAETTGETWHGYPVLEQGNQSWVDTGDYLGWVDITFEPFVYLYTFNNWGYLNNGNLEAAGDWIYVFK